MKMEDSVWDFSGEYSCPSYGRRAKMMDFNKAVFVRNPALLEPVKKHLWERRKGSPRQRPLGWKTASNMLDRLTLFAKHMEGLGLRQWKDVTPEVWDELVSIIPADYNKCPMLRDAKGVLNAPPEKEPLYYIPKSRYKPEKQTPPIPDYVMRAVVPKALAWEGRIPDLLRLRRNFDANDPWAQANGIRTPRDIKVAMGMGQTAAMILLLASTGMRVSELLSQTKGNGQMSGGLWHVWGTVFKFYGSGCRVRWFGGPMGMRAYQMLCDLSPVNDLCVSLWRAPNVITRHCVAWRMNNWLEREGIKGSDGNPVHLHPHQFRRTFARQLILHSKVTLLGLKDQFKHKKLSMTDYYIGCDIELYHALLGRRLTTGMDKYAALLKKAEEECG